MILNEQNSFPENPENLMTFIRGSGLCNLPVHEKGTLFENKRKQIFLVTRNQTKLS